MLVDLSSFIICPSILWAQHNACFQSYSKAYILKTLTVANPSHNKQDTKRRECIFFSCLSLIAISYFPQNITLSHSRVGGGYHVSYSLLLHFNFLFFITLKNVNIVFLGSQNTYFSLLIHHHLSLQNQNLQINNLHFLIYIL